MTAAQTFVFVLGEAEALKCHYWIPEDGRGKSGHYPRLLPSVKHRSDERRWITLVTFILLRVLRLEQAGFVA